MEIAPATIQKTNLQDRSLKQPFLSYAVANIFFSLENQNNFEN